ncbi:hypothetical protein DSECCO2_565930 [anaerobic digester metagenome]
MEAIPIPNRTPPVPTTNPSKKETFEPIKRTAGNTNIIPLATDSPPLAIPCIKFFPRSPFFLENADIKAEPIIEPGIPAATVRPDFIPE